MAFINSYTVAALEKQENLTCPARRCNEVVAYKLPLALPNLSVEQHHSCSILVLLCTITSSGKISYARVVLHDTGLISLIDFRRCVIVMGKTRKCPTQDEASLVGENQDEMSQHHALYYITTITSGHHLSCILYTCRAPIPQSIVYMHAVSTYHQ